MTDRERGYPIATLRQMLRGQGFIEIQFESNWEPRAGLPDRDTGRASAFNRARYAARLEGIEITTKVFRLRVADEARRSGDRPDRSGGVLVAVPRGEEARFADYASGFYS